ncbi:MAG: hypothetical protein RLZ07_1383 [Pseudomonadota bacterium]|jgi:hypothetical protein
MNYDKNLAEDLEKTLLNLAMTRGAGKTFCPSEAARAIGGSHPDGWGPLMTPVRRAAISLADEGRIMIYRKGKPVDPHDFKGVYRIGLPYSD